MTQGAKGPRQGDALSTERILRVAIDAPVMDAFDYLAPQGPCPQPGQRVLVPFRRGQRVGVVLEVVGESAVPGERLRRVLSTLDPEPLLDDKLLLLLAWAAGYYQHPPGEVCAAALPRLLRQGHHGATGTLVWAITPAGHAALQAGELARAPVQARLLDALAGSDGGLDATALLALASRWRPAMRELERRGLAQRRHVDLGESAGAAMPEALPTPTPAQAEAIAAIDGSSGFQPFLLQGVTGSGKTEVYLRCIATMQAARRQSLVLVPEIGLTPQLLARFRRRFPDAGIVCLHSGLGDLQRLEAWQRARDGRASIIIGTRSAVFVPLPQPGLIVVDEEHDGSFKQQDGFRYSARDIAVWRAHQLGMAVVLGSATPSLESLANVEAGRYRRLRLPERTAGARHPGVQLVDLRRHLVHDGLTQPLIDAIDRHLQDAGQVLIYLNRRGYAPTLMCTGCGQSLECRRCDARMVLHWREARLSCHHCGASRAVPERCATCGGELHAVGQGTERLEAALMRLFPGYPLVRIDRDTTRARGEVERRLEEAASGRARILLGTQMLAKGHDFPDVTLVGIIDADQGLFGTDFRAGERLAQTFVQVAGRAGRAGKPGEVYIQTLFPEHPLLQALIREGYDSFAEAALAERRAAGWPPFSHLAMLRAEAPSRAPALDFLGQARAAGEACGTAGIRLLGPAPAPMERRAGRYRAQLLVEAGNRGRLQRFLAAWRSEVAVLPAAARIRWSLDVDPLELF
ncbi:MAG: primosomal protein N' [Gammaproteobacteria bacterium]|nr:primosomal protein N' [Gammaproteobacteria bacterium]